ncbi:Protein ABHD14B [Lamellibrachia satsuma]|nr:Protein ABHD14B [Lamellibrachia satsuma]
MSQKDEITKFFDRVGMEQSRKFIEKLSDKASDIKERHFNVSISIRRRPGGRVELPAEHRQLFDIPADILSARNEVIIKEQYITLTVGDPVNKQKVTVFYLNASPLHEAPTDCSVLLLHGARFTSQNWHDIETLQLIGACGCRAVAVDLPGWGKSIKEDTKKLDSRYKPVLLERLITTLKLGKPVLVSPSMSGSFAIPFLIGDNPAKCGDSLTAFVALAPVMTDTYPHRMYHRCEIPALIVFGTKDETIGRTSVGNLRNMPSSKIFPMTKAGHACYIEQPDIWNRMLYNFLMALKPQKKR